MNEPTHPIYRLCCHYGCLVVFVATCSATSPTVPTANLTPAPVTVLYWDATGIKKFAVYSGAVRNTWTNRTVIATNQTIIKPGVAYGVASIDGSGLEGAVAYWPSNRIGEIRLKERGKTNYVVLEKFVESPSAPTRLWDVINVTVGWQ